MLANDTISIKRLLTTCSEIEFLAGEFYRTLARLHSNEPDAVDLWLKTAREEDNHKQQFELGQRMSTTIASSALIDQEMADRAIQVIQEAIAKLETSPSPPTVQSALNYAINMETKMMEFHMDQAFVFVSNYYRKMFKAMMNCDHEHIQALKAFLDRY